MNRDTSTDYPAFSRKGLAWGALLMGILFFLLGVIMTALPGRLFEEPSARVLASSLGLAGGMFFIVIGTVGISYRQLTIQFAGSERRVNRSAISGSEGMDDESIQVWVQSNKLLYTSKMLLWIVLVLALVCLWFTSRSATPYDQAVAVFAFCVTILCAGFLKLLEVWLKLARSLKRRLDVLEQTMLKSMSRE